MAETRPDDTRIAEVAASWLHCPIPEDEQHVSDFGRIASFDMTLVTITLENGLKGYGEAKAAVGSAGSCAALATIVENDLKPMLVGEDARRINKLWAAMYNGPRLGYAQSQGRHFPVLGRRGLWVSAMSGIDLALWDLTGKIAGAPVLQLMGGAVRDAMPAYASGGWADAGGIGDQLKGYTQNGLKAVKMRVGSMDGSVGASVERVKAARAALGPDIDIMVDAHGTFSAPEAKQFCSAVAEDGLRWFEEPVNPDSRRAMTEVRRHATMAIAAGESEFTCHDFQSLIADGAVDILQPDMAICGGMSEGVRISALAVANQLELAPHCWGSAFSFTAGLTLAFASPAARVIEYSLGSNPLLRDLVEETILPIDGRFAPPAAPGWGLTPDPQFVRDHTRPPH